jgi:hypothetical protein
MAKRIWRYGLSLALAAASSLALAQPPRHDACSDLDGNLDQTTQDVVADSPHFDEGGRRFPTQVFSIANPAPTAQNFLCLRYEWQNNGSETIPLAYWDLQSEGDSFDFLPQARRVRILMRPSASTEPVRGSTKIKAFGSQEVPTTAWMRVEDSSVKKISISSPFLRFEESAALDPEAKQAIKDRQIPDVEIAVFTPSPSGFPDWPAVQDIFRSPLGSFKANSRVSVPDKTKFFPFEVDTRIEIQPNPEIKIEAVIAPALVALERAESTAQFVKLLSESRQPWDEFSIAKGAGVSRRFTKESKRFFLIEHPVTIKWSTRGTSGSTCIRMASYSLFPVSLGSDYCIK